MFDKLVGLHKTSPMRLRWSMYLKSAKSASIYTANYYGDIVQKTTRNRDSNMELLRIMAIFLILFVHANFKSLGVVTSNHINGDFLDSFFRILFQFFGVIGVNVFILLSGWYGISIKAIKTYSILFQCVFYASLFYFLNIYIFDLPFSFKSFKECFLLTSDYWFVKSYLLLYLLSPVLNEFAKNVRRPIFKSVLIGLYAYQFIFAWLFYESTDYFNCGYSPLSFINLYLLARFLRLHVRISYNNKTLVCALFLSNLVGTVIYVLPSLIRMGGVGLGLLLQSYVSPLVIVNAIILLLMFYNFQFRSSVINTLATACFATYLIHGNAHVINYYSDWFSYLHDKYYIWLFWLLVVISCLIIYILSFIIDQFRIYIWRTIMRVTKISAEYHQ